MRGGLFEKTTNGVSNALLGLACIAIIAMMTHVVADVAAKYLLGTPIVGTLEIVSTYYMVAVVFLPLAFVQQKGGHIVVEVFTYSLPPRLIAALDALVLVVCLGILGIYIRETIVSAMSKTASRESWEATYFDIPVWPTRWFLPVGLTAMGMAMVLQVFRKIAVAAGLAAYATRL